MGVVSLLVELSYLSVVCICTKSESEHVTGMRNLLARHSLCLRYCGRDPIPINDDGQVSVRRTSGECQVNFR